MLNFPANPTAMVVDLEFYERVVAFCKKHDIIIISDLAYAEIYFDGNPPPSILQVPVRATLPWSSRRSAKRTRCPVGGWDLRPAMPRLSRRWRGLNPISTTAHSRRYRLPRRQHLTVRRIA